ncbi:mas-related G-protein coupled receptor member H-like [Corvus hawaiiensis]|uniref:mas-related G-protein coupled receptor member H-like n=1 Tax=Corvus hawaiiensis TaxID=134902 RepID=UPI002019A9B4|nr:mas-related G-protein coupled receptor member H-like [Corvus hawaiiensis]
MEVSSVFPPSASPTEGDDPCETDVTSVAIHSVTLLICLCGLAGNGAVLRLMVMTGSALFIFSLAVADFFFLLFALPSALLFLLEDVSCSPIMPLMYLSFLFQLSMVSYYWGLFRLTDVSAVSDMDSLCLLCCRCDLPLRLLWVVYRVQFWAFFALITAIPTVTFLCPSHKQEHCRVALIFMFALILLVCGAPMVISTSIIFIKAKSGSQQQQPKRRDIVVFLVALFTLLQSLWNILQQLGYTGVSRQVVFLLACIHSTIKPIIYFLAGMYKRPCSVRSLRNSLRRFFEDPEENTPSSNAVAKDSVI